MTTNAAVRQGTAGSASLREIGGHPHQNARSRRTSDREAPSRPCQGRTEVPGKDDKTLDEIEKTQAELRESIDEARGLVEKTDRLLKRHRKQIEGEE